MLKRRIIPCFDIQNGRTVKGVQFQGIIDAGDPIELAKRYVDQGADELVFLDITATVEKRKTLVELVERMAEEINIPFTVGGGIKSAADAALLIHAGADKVTINSAAVENPTLIQEIAGQFGSQCVVVAIDAKSVDNETRVYIHGGRKKTHWKLLDWAQKVDGLGAGEILLTSMNHDGTKDGFALQMTEQVNKVVSIPVIASGGAGSAAHFLELFEQTSISAGLAASVFHFGEIHISELKYFLKTNKINIR